MKTWISTCTDETERFACQFAQTLKPGSVIALYGGLGRGKTAFVRGLARGLHSTSEVSSPTFALVHEYDGDMPIFHFDMYRIQSLDDLYSTGFFDYLEMRGVVVIEWSENVAQYLPDGVVEIHIDLTDRENERRFTIYDEDSCG